MLVSEPMFREPGASTAGGVDAYLLVPPWWIVQHYKVNT